MKISLFVFGKDKPEFVHEGSLSFIKNLQKFATIEVIILKDEKVHDNVTKVLEKEADTLLKSIPANSHLIVCDDKGKAYDSTEFAKQISDYIDKGIGHLSIVIGSAHGLHQKVKDQADIRLSLSRMTMNHQLVRLVLLEQLYRAFTIVNGTPYHK